MMCVLKRFACCLLLFVVVLYPGTEIYADTGSDQSSQAMTEEAYTVGVQAYIYTFPLCENMFSGHSVRQKKNSV